MLKKKDQTKIWRKSVSQLALEGSNIVSQNKTVVLAILLMVLSACDGAGTEDTAGVAAQDQPSIRNVPDPAMAPVVEPAIALATKPDVLPTQLTLDKNQQRIFVPDLGWLPLAEFWDIYENNPARLPPDFDYKAMHQLKLSMAGKEHDDAKGFSNSQ
ncbi:hypothetical protein EYC98_05450 [Halieaceae bacterium IMCC14734]|uniref:Uncharacterized protein n=1 Tax=Candidatus Litorirhabdus singularis TaxID=2518993 RepID=A0ABT3TE79_9GAMM|nr:hypothetical protein [Candidatus Litorirhabdus singularis]MCX2980314.1 hypothetical protein [Candidatus Litorirhabdus singularis]